MTFESVMQLTRTVSSHAAFEDAECEAYFNVLMTLPKDALIVEIGLEYGRSSTIALQVAKEHHLQYVGIDPSIKSEWAEMAYRLEIAPILYSIKSSYVDWHSPINCILIDGDHSYATVLDDLNHFAPHVVSGGYVCMHDCGRESLPDVIKAAKEYFGTNRQWEKYQQAGTLAIWQRK